MVIGHSEEPRKGVAEFLKEVVELEEASDPAWGDRCDRIRLSKS